MKAHNSAGLSANSKAASASTYTGEITILYRFCIGLITSLLLGPSLNAQSYSVVELPGPAEGVTIAKGLNNSGHVAGRSGSPFSTQTRAYVTKGDGRFQILEAIAAGDYGGAFGINDLDQVIGSENTENTIQAILWTASLGRLPLPALAGDTASQGFGINNQGTAVGYSGGPNGFRACLWVGALARDLGTLPGGKSSRALGISDSGHVVGSSETPSGNHAFTWTDSEGMLDLGVIQGYSDSEAVAVDNAGRVVGFSSGRAGNTAFLWTKTTGMQDLGALPGSNFSRALAINDSGTVVGTSTIGGNYRAVVWSSPGGIQDLNDLVPANSGIVLLQAHAVNNRGQILAYGVEQVNTDACHMMEDHGRTALFLLTPSHGN